MTEQQINFTNFNTNYNPNHIPFNTQESSQSTNNNVNSNPNHNTFNMDPTLYHLPFTDTSNMTTHHLLRSPRNDLDALTLDVIDSNLAFNGLQTTNKSLDYTKIGSINIQGKYIANYHNILSFYERNNYDVLGITKIRQVSTHDHIDPVKAYPSDVTLPYIYLDTNGNDQDLASGIGFIISNRFQQQMGKRTHYKGRIISMDLHFKSNRNVRIINIYLPAKNTPEHKKLYLDCFRHLENLLNDAKNKKYYIILLGDFNSSNELTSKSPAYKKEIFNLLHLNNIVDSLKKHGDTRNTWSSGNNSSRIDYIFLSQHLFNHCFYGQLLPVTKEEFTTDHKATFVLLDLDFFYPNTYKQLNIHSPKAQKLVNYAKITRTTIDKYRLSSNTQIVQYKPSLDSKVQLLLQQQKYTEAIKSMGNFITTKINYLKKTYFPHKNRFTNSTRYDLPPKIRQIKNTITELHYIAAKFNLRRIYNPKISQRTLSSKRRMKLHRLLFDHSNDPDTQFKQYWNAHWPYCKHTLITVCNTFEINYSRFPQNINLANLKKVKECLLAIIRSIKLTFTYELNKFERDKIDAFIVNRNDNLTKNQTKMLNSILDRKPRKIHLDRIVKYDDNNNVNFITEPDKIANECIQHFQTAGSPDLISNLLTHYTTIDDLPENWKDIYTPKNYTFQSDINNLSSPITEQELNTALASLPKGKASGPSHLKYEDFIYLHDSFKALLLGWFNLILTHNYLPVSWKHALLYPIPKPQDWGCELTNTHPIVLLETPRKIFVKILTNRLQYILTSYNLTQHNNRACISGESVYEPLQKLQHIIETSNDPLDKNKKDLFICIQDMSKAYDRVNLSLLSLALQRLNFPMDFIGIIINLFSDRQNQIILPNNTSPSYNVLHGIDQGEIISPLLWIIYYDPMFEKINSLHNNTTMVTITQIKDINNPDFDIPISVPYNVIGYLDDTTWVSNSFDKLHSNLTTANEFYDLANIKVNVSKYKILTNCKDFQKKKVNLTINNTTHSINIGSKHASERILGIYINANNLATRTKQQIKKTVNHTAHTIRRKNITHDHVSYIINKVVIPQIEYISKFTFFNLNTWEQLMAPLKKLYKHSLSLPTSTHNNVIYNTILRSIKSAYYNQLHLHLSIINFLFNSSSLRSLAIQKVIIVQMNLWLPYYPTDKDFLQ